MPPKPKPPIVRMLAKVERLPTGCWIFTGARTRCGYGNLLGAEPGSRVYAHRLSYEVFVGPIPEGMQLDHLCSIPPCVNPHHLEAVTEAENHRRVAERRTHCKHGHAFTSDNTYWISGNRVCRACRLIQRAAYRARKRNAA